MPLPKVKDFQLGNPLTMDYWYCYPTFLFFVHRNVQKPRSQEHGFLSVVFATGFEPVTIYLEGKKSTTPIIMKYFNILYISILILFASKKQCA